MPEDLESRAQLAKLYSRRNQHDKAIGIWEALLEADPENTKYQDGLVDAYQDADKTTEAVELAQQYIETDAESSVNQSRLAKLYAANDQVDAAIDTYKKRLRSVPVMDKHFFGWRSYISAKMIWMPLKRRLRMPFNTPARTGNGKILSGSSWTSTAAKAN